MCEGCEQKNSSFIATYYEFDELWRSHKEIKITIKQYLYQ